jgi:hypothetical protein
VAGIPAVTPKDVLKVASDLDVSRMKIVVAGDKAVLLPALKALGIEPNEVIEPAPLKSKDKGKDKVAEK